MNVSFHGAAGDDVTDEATTVTNLGPVAASTAFAAPAASTHKTKFTIPVSQVANLIGVSNFNLSRDLVNLVKQIDSSLHRQWLKKSNRPYGSFVSPAEKIRRLDASNGTEFLAAAKDTSKPPLERQTTTLQAIEQSATITEEEKSILKAAVTEMTNCQHGIKNEKAVAALLQETSGIPVVTQQVQLDRTLIVETDTGLQFFLSGRCDGIDEHGTLLEFKSRQKRLFYTLRDYEALQVQLYLHMSKKQNGLLIEEFEKSHKTYSILYNAALCEAILDRLAQTLQFIVRVIEDEDEHILEQLYQDDFSIKTIHPDALDFKSFF